MKTRRSITVVAAGVAAALTLALLPAAGATAAGTTVVTNGNIYFGQGATLKADGSPSGIAPYAGSNIYDSQLSFSPDGSRLVVRTQADAGAPTFLQTANADFTARKTIVPAGSAGYAEAGSPAWSPNGAKIALLLYTGYGSTSRIATVNPDGTGLTVLANTTDLGTYRDNVSWYPDSKRLIYINSANKLCTVSIATTTKTCSALPAASVTGAAYDGSFTAPKISPDGQYVAMTLYIGTDIGGVTRYDVARTSPTGTGFVNLTKSAAHGQYTAPLWSPDGKSIAFGVTRPAQSGASGLGLISRTGTGLKVVAGSFNPEGWQPKVVTASTPSALTVVRERYCGNDGGYYSWLALKGTWQADPKSVVASYRIYENGALLTTVTNTRTSVGPLSSSFASSQWMAQSANTLVYTVKGVAVNGQETPASNSVTIHSPALDC